MQGFNELSKWLGIPRNTTSHGEKLISALGGSVGILVVAGLAQYLLTLGVLDFSSACLVVASMGASAVLLFAVPHGALSQPWALIGGNLISAFIGVSVVRFLGVSVLSSALAVGFAIAAMYYLRCIHPPGGATALTTVIGGDAIQNLEYFYMVVPVLLNVGCIFFVAVGFNFFFRWRRYPAHLYYKSAPSSVPPAQTREFELTQEDFSAAIQKHDSFVDITEEGLTELLERAKKHAEMNIVHPAEIKPGKYYSNGKLGKLWSIRQVVDAADGNLLPSKDKVIFKIVAGHQSYDTGICLREEFRSWARFEVIQSENRWIKAS